MSAAKGCTPIIKFMQQREYNSGLFSVNSLMRERLRCAHNLFRKDLYSHYGCVNAIEFSSDGEWLVSGGDDRRILVWNVEKALHGNNSPISMKGEHGSNIFCLGFDNRRLKIFSAGNDEQVIVHDFVTGSTVDIFLHEEAVYGLSVDPLNDNVFASACEDGRILIWDIREPSSTEPFCLANSTSAFHSVMYNPLEPRLLATANSKEGVSLWDIRSPQKNCILKYGNGVSSESCMSVRFNSDGTRILALRRRLPPVLYNLCSPTPTCQFDHREYYNSCTMKSCCFAGDNDQYVLSGSDDFNLYMWRIPDESTKVNWVDEAHVVLRGHRSIVNQVRFNHSNFLLASSGVEKIIKLWSPFPVPNSSGGLYSNNHSYDKERKVYSHEEYISLILQSGQVMSHDYSHKSTMEDPRMMAFFDSLVQREIEGWNSDSSLSSVNNIQWLDGSIDTPSDTDTTSSSSTTDDMVIGNRSVSPATAYGLSAVTSQDNPDDPNSSTELGDQDDTDGLSGGQNANRISQLIAQKRQQLMQAARAKVAHRLNRQSYSHHSLYAPRPKESQTRSRVRRGRRLSSTDDSSDTDENVKQATMKRKLAELRSKPVSDRRKYLRKHRIKVLKGVSDSNSDVSDSAASVRNGNASRDFCGAAKDGGAQPSTSQLPAINSNLVCYKSSDSDDEEAGDAAKGETKSKDAASDTYASSNTGTPDSGIGSNNGENVVELVNTVSTSRPTAWTQFKRIRSRLERACRNYRTHNADRENSD